MRQQEKLKLIKVRNNNNTLIDLNLTQFLKPSKFKVILAIKLKQKQQWANKFHRLSLKGLTCK
jgi:hypothetical protein